MVKKAYEKEINFDQRTQLIKLPPQSQLSVGNGTNRWTYCLGAFDYHWFGKRCDQST